jgi:HEAT repeat protein
MSDEPQPQPEVARADATAPRQLRLRSVAIAIACLGALIWTARVVWENRDLDHSIVRESARATRSGDTTVRLTAVRDLGRFGSKAREVAMPALLASTKDQDAEIRSMAAEGLGQVAFDASDARTTAVALTELSKDSDPRVRLSTVVAYRMLVGSPRAGGQPPMEPGTALNGLLGLIGDSDDGVRGAAFTGLGVAGSKGAEPPSQLIAALDDPSPAIRASAFSAISQFSKGLDPLIPALLKAVEQAAPANRPAYSRAIRNMKPPAITAAIKPVLAEAIAGSNPTVRCRAIDLLVQLGPEAAPMIPTLIKIVNESTDPAPDGRGTDDPARSAASALGELAPGTDQADKAVAALIAVLQRGEPARRRAATGALAKFTQRAAVAVPGLVERLKKSVSSEISIPDGTSTCEALCQIAPGTDKADEAVAALLAATDADAPRVRVAAVEALAFFPANAPKILPHLKELESDTSREVRAAVAETTGYLQPSK